MAFRIVYRAARPLPRLGMDSGDLLVWDTSFEHPFQVVRAIDTDAASVAAAGATGALVEVSYQGDKRALQLI